MSAKSIAFKLSPLAFLILQACSGSSGDETPPAPVNTAPAISQFQVLKSGSAVTSATNDDVVTLSVQATDADNDSLNYNYAYQDIAGAWQPLSGSGAAIEVSVADMFGFRVQVGDGKTTTTRDITFESLLNDSQVLDQFTSSANLLSSALDSYIGVAPLSRGKGIIGVSLADEGEEVYEADGPLGTANAVFHVGEVTARTLSDKVTALSSLLNSGVFQPVEVTPAPSAAASARYGSANLTMDNTQYNAEAMTVQMVRVRFDTATSSSSIESSGSGFTTVGAVSVECAYNDATYALSSTNSELADNLGGQREQWMVNQAFIDTHFADQIGTDDTVTLTACSATHDTGGDNTLNGTIAIEFVIENSDAEPPEIAGEFIFPEQAVYTNNAGQKLPLVSAVGVFTPSYNEAISEETLSISLDGGNSFQPLQKTDGQYVIDTAAIANDAQRIVVTVQAKDMADNAASNNFEQAVTGVEFDTQATNSFDGSEQTLVLAYPDQLYPALFGQHVADNQIRLERADITATIAGESVQTLPSLWLDNTEQATDDTLSLPTQGAANYTVSSRETLDKTAENLTAVPADYFAQAQFTIKVVDEVLSGDISFGAAERFNGLLRDGQTVAASVTLVNQLGQAVVGTVQVDAKLDDSPAIMPLALAVGENRTLSVDFVRQEDNKVLASTSVTIHPNTPPVCAYTGPALTFTEGDANYTISSNDISCNDAEDDSVSLSNLTINLAGRTAGTYSHGITASDERTNIDVSINYTVSAPANTAPTIADVGSFDGSESQYNTAYAPANINLTAPTCADDNAGDTLSVNIYKNGSFDRSVSSGASFTVNYPISFVAVDNFSARCYDGNLESSVANIRIVIYESF
ncbi:hypothetical protein SAMN06297280_1528 [Arsukibacterium tuosuense]|uniref:Uncharacterized protein n=1 Tax=Arsukibacterium tuosuense TaxID=1323745 RepID=A0A285IP32_9GAMM|nr:hypothetical protein [Arsukibacterium tuosuense]SNY49748.1 hypothetical protein SAMN06297280_1528 [Arsukibacterium tuosuense]